MERDGQLADLSEMLSLSTMALATAGPNNQPHTAPVYFAADNSLQFFFFSDPDSQHCRDLAQNTKAAAAVYPECFDWQDIRGIQMSGQAMQVEPGPDWERAWQLYQSKYPFVAGMKDVLSRNTMYVFIPSWLRLVDNRLGFGYKREWRLT